MLLYSSKNITTCCTVSHVSRLQRMLNLTCRSSAHFRRRRRQRMLCGRTVTATTRNCAAASAQTAARAASVRAAATIIAYTTPSSAQVVLVDRSAAAAATSTTTTIPYAAGATRVSICIRLQRTIGHAHRQQRIVEFGGQIEQLFAHAQRFGAQLFLARHQRLDLFHGVLRAALVDHPAQIQV